MQEGVEKNPTFAGFIERAGHEYAKLSETPKDYDAFVAQISKMWDTEPNSTDAQLQSIRAPVLVVDGDHDEAIKRAHTEYIAATIPGAGLLILPNTSHFAFLQDPTLFNAALEAGAERMNGRSAHKRGVFGGVAVLPGGLNRTKSADPNPCLQRRFYYKARQTLCGELWIHVTREISRLLAAGARHSLGRRRAYGNRFCNHFTRRGRPRSGDRGGCRTNRCLFCARWVPSDRRGRERFNRRHLYRTPNP